METSIQFYNPHETLGMHCINDETKVIRLWNPGRQELYLEVQGKKVLAERVGAEGFFEVRIPKSLERGDYKVWHKGGFLAEDPYTFPPLFGDVDAHLFSKGVHYRLYEVLGAKICKRFGCQGVQFAVWAPSAYSVFLVGDFNGWDERVNPMRCLGSSGVWELFIPGLGSRERYKFAIVTRDEVVRLKSDPLAFFSELRSGNASVTFDIDAYKWQDQEWMQKRSEGDLNQPINVYEVHLGSWKKGDRFFNYRELSHELACYVKEMGFSHIEILPISEHPLDESWGYQVSGFYAATSRYGTPEDFQYFINHMHENGIGVILDWVPAHFPSDDFSLSNFDGTALYEHSDSRRGYHPHWNTCIFNYGRFEVSNFLIANALFWMDKMHVDGLRVDAVASMIYLDYGRKEGEWLPNEHGGRENLEALEFLKHLNSVVHEKFPKVLMIAEESSSFEGITHPLALGGSGFDLKWNMGWMNDTLNYFKTDPIFRKHVHSLLTFGLLYAFSERFMLVLSHDEVVHGKASFLSKMPGDEWQKFAQMRLLYSYMICHPGKKLLFMGGEVGQWSEWNCKSHIDWDLLEYPLHKSLQRCIKNMNYFYKDHPALWEKDFEGSGFEWVDCSDQAQSIISYLRRGRGTCLLCIHNFTPVYRERYKVFLKNIQYIQEVFSTDREEYGGSGKLNHSLILQRGEKEEGIVFQIAPLATMIFEVRFV